MRIKFRRHGHLHQRIKAAADVPDHERLVCDSLTRDALERWSGQATACGAVEVPTAMAATD
eukprot:11226592-Lingulodinium_polyedra.AAC.1